MVTHTHSKKNQRKYLNSNRGDWCNYRWFRSFIPLWSFYVFHKECIWFLYWENVKLKYICVWSHFYSYKKSIVYMCTHVCLYMYRKSLELSIVAKFWEYDWGSRKRRGIFSLFFYSFAMFEFVSYNKYVSFL